MGGGVQEMGGGECYQCDWKRAREQDREAVLAKGWQGRCPTSWDSVSVS